MSYFFDFDFISSDNHFRHRRIVKDLGIGMREKFDTIEEHDEELIRRWNAIVAPDARVLCVGDFAFQTSTSLDLICPRLNGIKFLVKGNHDTGDIDKYTDYFDDILGYPMIKLGDGNKAVVSHVPIHPQQLQYRWAANVHGHTHEYSIPDPRYINVCLEQTNLAPISKLELMTRIYAGLEEYNSAKKDVDLSE